MHSCEHCTEAGLTSFNVVPYPTPSASHDSLVRALSGRLVLGQALQTLCPSSTLHWQLFLRLCDGFRIQNCPKIAARAGCPTCGGGNWAFNLCASPTNFQTSGSACSSPVDSALASSSMGSQNQSTTTLVSTFTKPGQKNSFFVPNLTQFWRFNRSLLMRHRFVVVIDTKRSNLKPNHQI